MRSQVLWLAVMTALSACQPPGRTLSDQERSALTAEVDRSVTSLLRAMNAHDSTAVLGHYARGDSFTYVGVTDVQYGSDTFRRANQLWYARHPDVHVDYRIVQTRIVSPTVAVVLLRGSSTLQPALAMTEVLVRGEHGRWRVVHEHESWPEPVASGAPHPVSGGESGR